MDYRVLGPIEVHDDAGPRRLPRGHALTLLAALLMHGGQPASADRLIEWLWGDEAPATARTALQVHLSKLRQALGSPSAIETSRAGYCVPIADTDIDALRYGRLVADAQIAAAAEPLQARALLDEADRLWRGTPYLDVADRPWAAPEVARLVELGCHAEELRGDIELGLGEHATIVGRLRRAADLEPLREKRWAQLMIGLYRSGRQAEALREFQRARRRLIDDIGVEPGPELRELERRVLLQDPLLGTTIPLRPGPGNLTSPMTALVGREEEVTEARRRLGEARLVTLSGPGGIGKTRLAVDVAIQSAPAYADGVWQVDLAPVSSPPLLADLLASALGLVEPIDHRPTTVLDLLRNHLRERSVLLVLDGCEHIAAEVAAVVQLLLTYAPGLRVLATSRSPLGVDGESTLVIPPLPVPPHEATDAEHARSPAVRLFVERSDGRRDPGSDELRAIGDLCRFLDGLPLAIELAAATFRGIAPSDVLSQLPSSLAVSGTDDGSALEATIDWSYSLLAASDRIVLRRLSVFAAGFTLDGATAVTSWAADRNLVTGSVARLVHASLVGRDARAAPARYALLDTVREYAAMQLRARSEEPDTSNRLAAHLTSLGGRLRGRRMGPLQNAVLAELDAEHENIRATLENLFATGRNAQALELATACGDYWFERGHWAAGARWLRRALAACEEPSRLRAQGLLMLARVSSSFAGIASHVDELLEARDIMSSEVDAPPADRFYLAAYIGTATGWLGRVEESREALQIARAVTDEIVDDDERAWSLAIVDAYEGLGRALAGEAAEARRIQHECAERLLGLGDPSFAGRLFMYAGNLARISGDARGARSDLERSIELSASTGTLGTLAHARLTLAMVAAELGDADATSLLLESRAVLDGIGDVRCRALAERALGGIALDGGAVDEALGWLRRSLPALAETDEPAFAVGLADVGRAHVALGDPALARQLVDAAEDRAGGLGVPLAVVERRRLEAARAAVASIGVADASPTRTIEELLALAGVGLDL